MALYGLKKPEFMTKDLWDKYMDNFLPILDSLKNHERFHLEERDFNVLDLINEVENGKIPLVEIKYPTAECTHHVIVRGFTGNKIKIVNPLNGFESYNIDDFEEKINIGYMKNFISLSKPEGLEVKLISAGLSASKGDSRGLCQVIDKYDENFAEGRILVASRTDPDMTPNMISSSGIITDQGGILCHAAIVSRELGIPCVVGTEKSTSLLETGDFVYLDADSGRIYLLK
jgi:phosphohistidine swiveling domain-containing protein